MTDLLTPAEAAALMGVSTKTLARWARKGLIIEVRTPGGNRRYPAEPLIDLRDKAMRERGR